MSKVEKTMKKSALFIAFSWLLLMVFTVVSANAENISAHTPTSKNMVYYPQGCRCCWFIWKPQIHCGKVYCEEGCC
ncbi:hypothetical protein MtrunA17_Chr2g0290811 [Medicago truncatula]|uniref:Transmembrane protein, putative n=1 Tax=Medicago truncatula TaxID=3880 RepID=G7IQ54_MEDTR|nr:transmembrane protein, putative [Medicago truncatula]RHN72719.1 hypothetical protein MtrunA17_Chr2g0290811 [Medicago truncatula]